MALHIENPYLSTGYTWLRGNLHAHTTLSDGASLPYEVISDYEKFGYDFLAISDHDLLVPPSEYQSLTSMTLIPADEVTANGPHILVVGMQELILPTRDRQQVLDATNAQGAFAVLNHPNWQQHFNHFPQELMVSLTGYVGIEIYNGVAERLAGSALATDRWDKLLSTGRKVWGFAHDDSHRFFDIGRGWNVVQAADRSVEAICDAFRQGHFYASTGVEISQITLEDETLFLTAPNAQRIRFMGAWGEELAYSDSHQAQYTFSGREGKYVRVECYGEGTKTAWTQPFYLKETSQS